MSGHQVSAAVAWLLSDQPKHLSLVFSERTATGPGACAALDPELASSPLHHIRGAAPRERKCRGRDV